MKTLKKTETQEIAVIETKEQIPDYLKHDLNKGNLGMETLGNQDMTVPRLKVMQGLSPEKERFSWLKNGDFFHTAHEIALPQPLLAVPIIINKRYILWRPRSQGGGILARANDGKTWMPSNTKFSVSLTAKEGGPANVVWETKKSVLESGLANWGTSNPNDPNSAPAATLMYNILLAFPANEGISPAVLTLQRTGEKVAKALHMKLRNTNRPIFQCVVRFTTFLDHGGGNEFYNVNTELAGIFGLKRLWCARDKEPWTFGSEEQYENYKALYETISREGLDVRDEEGLQESEELVDDKIPY